MGFVKVPDIFTKFAFRKYLAGKELIFLNSSIVVLFLINFYLIFLLTVKLSSHTKTDTSNIFVDSIRTVQVEVLNGCGKVGVGEKSVDFLRKHRMDVVQTGNYISFNVPNTLIVDRGNNMERAKYIANLLSVDTSHILRQYNRNYYLDVSVILGKDYKSLSFFK